MRRPALLRNIARMQYRQLGRSGLRVSEISLGSWLTYGATVDVGGASKIVAAALELGINLFDTADVYASGAAEESLREALRGVARHKVVIATKAFFPMSDDVNDRGLSRKHLFESVELSLRRLGTDYVDLHQCHRADPSVPIDETVRAYEDLIRAGKVLYWGVSEWDPKQIDDAVDAASACGGYAPISSQPQYSMLRRGIEKKLLRTCKRAGIGQIVWSPMAQGVLTGKYGTGVRPEGTRAAHPFQSRFMEAFLKDDVLARVERLRPIAEELDLTLSQLALAWCLRQQNVASAIVGATSPEQIQENAKASGVVIPPEALAKIDALFPA
jgi:voltage-dependent potassium channel beta subunit